ncbi:hypothetical protein K501DRAFT_336646 [Backusella circina FSU 941]|nr:hypothetical protein K501DRAFT_336646 [Backusella circina FSU 941]
MNSFGVLSDTLERLEPVDVEFFKFTSLVPDAKVSIQTDPFAIANYPTPVSLLACSSKLQYFVAGTTTGFIYGNTKTLRTCFYNTEKGEVTTLDEKISVSLSSKVRQVKLSAAETSVFITTSDDTLLVYHIEDIKRDKEQVKPVKTINLANAALEIKPNPEAHPNLIAVLYENHTIVMIDVEVGATARTFPMDNYTTLCWSRKGKQIVCGNKEGVLIAYDTNGEAKDMLEVPAEMCDEKGNRFVQDVLWVDNNVFFAIYTSPLKGEEFDYENDAYVIDRKINQSNQEGYIRLAEITPIFASEGRGNRFYIELIPHLGKEINNAIIIANSASNEISVVGENEEGEWNTWMLPENGTATLPLTDESQDTYPLGLAVDFAADEKLAPFDASENDKPVEPFPIFYYINDEGQIGAYHCYNVEMARRGESYAPPSSEPPKSTSQPATTSAFGSGFNQPSTSGSSFSDLLSGKATSNAAQSGSGFGSFGAAMSNNNSSGSFASLASTQKLPAAPSMGMKTTLNTGSTPAFGSTSSVGFGSQSSFGITAAAKPSTPFGGIISAETKKEDTPQKNVETATTKSFFGTSTTTPAFGSTSFGTSTTKPAFGATFGMSTTTPSFGSASFGTSTTKPAFGASTTTPAFGYTSFGSLKTATTSTSSGSPSASTTGGFGALAKSAAPNTSTPNTASALESGGGFGALAKNTVPGASNPTSSPSFGSTSGFGALAKNTVAGATAPSSTSAFGSTSGFGALAKNTVAGATAPSSTPAFGSTSGFGALAKNTVPGAANPSASPSFGSTSGFGALAKNTVEGAKNPNAAPAFGSATSFGAAATKKDTEKLAAPTTIATGTSETESLAKISTTLPAPTASNTTSSSPEAKGVASTVGTSSAVKTISTATTPTKIENKTTTSTTPAPAPSGAAKGPTSTDKEGIAFLFEQSYFKTGDVLKENELLFKRVSDQIQKASRALNSKTVADLKTATEWNLNDVTVFKSILEGLESNMSATEPHVTKMKEQLVNLTENLDKLIQKRKNIEDLMDRELSSSLIDLMDARELNDEAKKSLHEIQGITSATLVLLEQLELKVHELTKRYKLYDSNNSSNLSLYSLHRMIRDIERGLTSKSRDLEKVSQQLSNLSIKNAHTRARYATNGYSCDFSDSEDDEESVKPSAIEYTQKYIYRTQFLDTLCDAMGKKKPNQVSLAQFN